MGGLFFTCGLQNICGPCETDGVEYPMHGRLRTTPAEHLCSDAYWDGEDYVLEVSGEMRESHLFGANLVLRRKIRSVYGSIMRIQMLIVGPMAVVLLGFPRVVLRVLAEELVSYDWLFMGCSVIFLLVSTLGPCGGILQMTGNEKADNRIRGCSLVLMAAVMLLTVRDSYFVLYGLCVEVAAEAVAKYFYICRWMKKAPASLVSYLGWWVVPALAVGLAHVLKAGDSFWLMLLFAGSVFAFSGWHELKGIVVFKKK
jgi:O-antigen/teichoic acid export membrane protein